VPVLALTVDIARPATGNDDDLGGSRYDAMGTEDEERRELLLIAVAMAKEEGRKRQGGWMDGWMDG